MSQLVVFSFSRRLRGGLFALALLLSVLAEGVTPAQAHSHVSISFGVGCCGPSYYYDPFWGPPPVYPLYYAPPPRVVYVEPVHPVYRPVETVYVQEPAYVPAPVIEAPAAMPATQTSPTYTDERGRTCRRFETLINRDRVIGKACLQNDGTWRTVE